MPQFTLSLHLFEIIYLPQIIPSHSPVIFIVTLRLKRGGQHNEKTIITHSHSINGYPRGGIAWQLYPPGEDEKHGYKSGIHESVS